MIPTQPFFTGYECSCEPRNQSIANQNNPIPRLSAESDDETVFTRPGR